MFNAFFMACGILFHDYSLEWSSVSRRSPHVIGRGSFVRTLWLVTTVLLFFSFQSNLKASLIIRTYEDKIETLDEMLER